MTFANEYDIMSQHSYIILQLISIFSELHLPLISSHSIYRDHNYLPKLHWCPTNLFLHVNRIFSVLTCHLHATFPRSLTLAVLSLLVIV